MNSNLYYNKYIKYKNKYLELKTKIYNEKSNENQQINKIEEINCAITTHNGRLRCLLSSIGFPTTKLINNENQEKKIVGGFFNFGNKENKEIRFKNCAILLFEINSSIRTIRISLIHDGEISNNSNKSKKYYYVKKLSDSNINLNEIEFPLKEYTDKEYFKILHILHIMPEDLQNKILNIYMIRHGEGIHNLMEGIHKIKKLGSKYVDAGLTDLGKIQASNASKSIMDIKFDYIFVSDLARTRQTIQEILQSNTYRNLIKEIIVLPCSHELNYNKSGLCDRNQNSSLIENENKISCKIFSDTCNLIDNDKLCCAIQIPNNISKNNKNIELNWKYYREFYKNKTRSFLNTDRLHCRDTSMISIALYIINNNHNNIIKMKEYIDKRIYL